MVEHPTVETIAAYLSGGLLPSERVALEGHLSGCRECRQEVLSARRLLETRPMRPRWQVLIPAAAAAVLAVALGGGLLLRGAEDTVRSSAGEMEAGAAQSIRAMGPANRAMVARDGIVFVWRASPDRSLYRLTLTDGSGHTVWAGSTADTSLRLPPAVPVAPGRTYFWYVDALDTAGRSLTTGTLQFSTAP